MFEEWMGGEVSERVCMAAGGVRGFVCGGE